MSISLKWCNKEWASCSGGREISNLKDGIVYIDNFNEELDSATIVLQNIQKQDFEPSDLMILTFPDGQEKHLIINDFVENEVEVGSNLYQYTINLVSKTKLLERIPLPNISITKPTNGYHELIRDVCRNIIEDYSPKLILNGRLFNAYMNGITSLKDCPDLQMSTPTLKEALNRILSSDNSICYVTNNNAIYQMDLNRRGDEIELYDLIDPGHGLPPIRKMKPYYNYKPENQSMEDYASETENNYNNVVPNELENIDEDTITSEYIGFRTEDMLVKTDNGVLITQKPIYKIKQLLLCGELLQNSKASSKMNVTNMANDRTEDIDIGAYQSYYYEIDISKYILEIQDYNIQSYEDQKYYGYFVRGDNKINGLLDFKKEIIEQYETIKKILQDIIDNYPRDLLYNPNTKSYDGFLWDKIKETFGSDVNPARIRINSIDLQPNQASNDSYLDYYNLMFKITYEAQNENVRVKTTKYLPERNQNNIIIDNPGEAYTDIKRQGELFYDKCNRLGNRVKELHARFSIEQYINGDVPSLADYIDDYVLIRRELCFYDDYIVFKGILTENYVNINYFTGINARKRTWNLVSAEEAFDKQLLDKWYIELAPLSNYSTPISDELNWSHIWGNNRNDFLNAMLPTYPETGTLDTKLIGKVHIANNYTEWESGQSHVEVDLSKYISGNSIIFHCKAMDNYSLGISIDDVTTDNPPLIIEKYCKYTDGNGFATYFYIDLYLKDTPPGAQYLTDIRQYWGDRLLDDVTGGEDLLDNYFTLSWTKPYVYIPNMETFNNLYNVYGFRFQNHKDSREKLGFNIQFEFCSKTKDIVIGECFMEYNRFISSKPLTLTAYLLNETLKVTDRNNTYDGYTGGISCNMTLDSNNILNFNFGSSISGHYKSVVICDQENRLFMGFNLSGVSYSSYQIRIHIDMLRLRDRNNYTTRAQTNWST